MTIRSSSENTISLSLRAICILLVGAGAGLVYNGVSEYGIPLRTPPQVPIAELVNWSLHVEGLRATLQTSKKAFDRNEATFIDARSAKAYAAGHIPGALSLPVGEFQARSNEVLKDFPKDTRLITYCSGRSCQSRIRLAHLMIEKLGYTQTQAFFDGWSAWNSAGYPFVIGETP